MSWKRLCMPLMLLSLGVAACSSNPASSEGACALTKASPTQVTRVQTVTVSAADMWEGCNDQGSNLQPPLKNQLVTISVDGKAVEARTDERAATVLRSAMCLRPCESL